MLTSAVRDAANGEEFVTRVREVYGIDAHVIPGDEEARLTFLGATAGATTSITSRSVDIGGGSTEIVTGRPAFARRCRWASCGSPSAICTTIRRSRPSCSG